MQEFHSSLINLIIALAILAIYVRVSSNKFRKCLIVILPIFYVAYRLLVVSWLNEPFRLLLSFLFFIVALMIFSKKFSLTWVGFAFFTTHILWLLSSLMSIITLLVIGTSNELVFGLVALIWPIVTFASFLLLDKQKKINLSAIGLLLGSSSVQKMFIIIGFLIMALYSFINFGANLDAAHYSSVSMLIWGLTLAVALAILFLTIFTVKHLNAEKRQQLLLEAENARLEQGQLDVQNQLAELDSIYTTLKNDFGKVTSHYHNYKYSIPVLLNMQQKLLEELNQFAKYTNAEKSEWIRNHTEQFKALTFDVSHDLIADQVKQEVASLDIPTNRIQLASLLEKLIMTAQNQEIYLSISNQILAWESVCVSDITLLRLISNIVDNAIKESCKIPKADRGEVRLTFTDADGIFAFEVSDYAHEFDLEILKKLGDRKNSTNGTGDGYCEIIAALNEVQASLIIKEWRKDERYGKTISVIFDNCNMKLIDSNYRHELLKHSLENTELEVMDA